MCGFFVIVAIEVIVTEGRFVVNGVRLVALLGLTHQKLTQRSDLLLLVHEYYTLN
jgi:hypothetical protein